MKTIVSILFTLLFAITGTKAAFVAQFYGPGYIGQNKTYFVSDPTYNILARNGDYESKWASKNAISFFATIASPTAHYSWWEFEFAAPGTQALTTGLYTNVSRYPFSAPNATMDVSGDGRGSNEVGGWFRILEIGWDSNGNVNKAAVDFYHLSEKSSSSWTQGSIRFNSDIPLSAVPEPTTIVLSALSLPIFFWRKR